MTFTAAINAGELSRIASGASRVAPKTNAIPIIGAAKLEMAAARLTATATDLNQTIEIGAPAKGHGKIATPIHQLAAICATLDPEADADLYQDGNTLHVKQGRVHFKLPTLPPEDFPPVTVGSKDAVSFTCDGKEFAAALTSLAGVVVDDVRRRFLSGVLVELTGKTVTLVGCDGNTLGAIPVAAECAGKLPRVIVPLEVLSGIAGLAKAAETPTFWACQNLFGVTSGSIRYQTKVVDGDYPDWRKQLRPKSASHMLIETADLRRLGARVHATLLPYVRIEAGEKITASGVAKLTDMHLPTQVVEEFDAHTFEGVAQTLGLGSDTLRWLADSFNGSEVLDFAFDTQEFPIIVTAPGKSKANVRMLTQVRV